MYLLTETCMQQMQNNSQKIVGKLFLAVFCCMVIISAMCLVYTTVSTAVLWEPKPGGMILSFFWMMGSLVSLSNIAESYDRIS